MTEAYFGSGAVRALRFDIVDPHRLQTRQTEDVTKLISASLAHDFSAEHSQAAISHATARRIESWRHLNETVPGGATGTWQRYYNPRGVVAYDVDGNLDLYLQFADNTSSSRRTLSNPVSWFPPRLQIEAKQRLPQLIKSRHHAIGIVAVSPQLRDGVEVAYASDTISIVDTAIAVSMGEKPAEESIVGYRWNGEQWLRSAYESDGLTYNPSNASMKDEFGDGVDIQQEPWKRDGGLGVVSQTILSKDGADLAIVHAFTTARLV